MSLLLKIACPDCGHPHEATALGSEVRCGKCGRDFRAQADGESAGRVLSVTPDELDNVPYSQRSIEVPVNKVSSVIVSDPSLLADKMLRDAPLKENSKWVGKVRLLKKLGQGGMGAVYRGYDESLALDVAVKILPSLDERDSQFVERFRQEARISAKINHPNVVRTLHVDEEGGLLFLVMDYVEGQTARSLVDRKGPLALPLALQIVHDAARGMQAAHEHGVIHRDIKPDNILVADDGRVLLSDLGLAKAATSQGPGMPVTRMGLLLGTPEYMSPEQWDIGANIGPSADIWSMGATFWMLLTRRPPFDERDLAALARRVRDEALPDIRDFRPGLPDSVIAILGRCLAKRPQDRYASGKELMAAVNDALGDLAGSRGAPEVPQAVVAEEKKAEAARLQAASIAAAAAPESEKAGIYAKAIASREQLRSPVIIHVPVQSKRSAAARLAWVALPAIALAALGYWKFHDVPPPAAAPVAAPVAVDLRCSTRVKPGEEAELVASVNGSTEHPDYTVIWQWGQKSLAGGRQRVALEHDAEFSLVVREQSSGLEVARRGVKVAVDLTVRAAEKELYRIETGTPLRLEGRVLGGAEEQKYECRWIDLDRPETVLSQTPVLELAAKESPPGRRNFSFQARRGGSQNWSEAAAGKVVVEVTRHVPPEFKAAMRQGLELRLKAAQAGTGAEALENWKRAIAAYEQAGHIFPDTDEAGEQAALCKQHLATDEKYAALLEEGQRLKKEAEAVAETDKVRRLAAWSDALRPFGSALALFERAEARTQAVEIEARVATMKATMEKAERERELFDGLIAQARHSTKEAKKYLSPTVALPHWEAAVSGFEDLAKRYPKRADEFALELKEVQENRDKAYLYENFGVVPARPVVKDAVPEKPKTPPPAPKPSPRVPEPGAKR